jgi:hypothetical protein
MFFQFYQYSQYDDMTLLSALQSITVYLLLQASEKEHKEDECTALLVTLGVRRHLCLP